MKLHNIEKKFEEDSRFIVKRLGKNKRIKSLASQFVTESVQSKYLYNFHWLGRPILQYPQDMVALQEIIWEVKPDLIIETGIAYGGSLIFSASILELLGGKGVVLGIDIGIWHRDAIMAHPLSKRIRLIEGSSIDQRVIEAVKKIARGKKRILVYVDSHHSHSHVLRELELYSKFVTKGSYFIVFDTVIEYLPPEKRPWGKGNSPLTAVKKFLRSNKNFIVDKDIENKILITVAPGGFLKRVR